MSWERFERVLDRCVLVFLALLVTALSCVTVAGAVAIITKAFQ